jgi:tRNA(adenine34) deaminase
MIRSVYCTCPRITTTRRSVIAAIACACVSPVVARAQAGSPTAAADERFMRMAIEEARQADFPFGTVIVRDGEVIARGRNLGRTNGDPTAHGEMVAIRRCLAELGRDALRGSTLYSSGEPCAMCMGAILLCQFGRLVYAASVAQLAAKIDQIMISSADLAARAPFAPIDIDGGVLAADAMALFAK